MTTDGSGLKIPADIQAHWAVVLVEYFSLRGVWDSYSIIYRKRRGLISGALRLHVSFLLWLRRPLRDGVALGIARLLDPAVQGKSENLVLDSVIQLAAGEPGLVRQLEAHKARISASFTPFRNKVLAHRDRAVAMKTVQTQPAVTDEEIDEALEAIYMFVNTVSMHFEGSSSTPRAGIGGLSLDETFDIVTHGIQSWWREQLKKADIQNFLRVHAHFSNHLTELARERRLAASPKPDELERARAFEGTVEEIARTTVRHLSWSKVRAQLQSMRSEPRNTGSGAQEALAAALEVLAGEFGGGGAQAPDTSGDAETETAHGESSPGARELGRGPCLD